MKQNHTSHMDVSKKIMLAWAAVIFVGSLISQLVSVIPHTNTQIFLVWTALITAGVVYSTRQYKLTSLRQALLQIHWVMTILIVLLLNMIGVFVIGAGWILNLNIFILWTVVIAVGYVITGRLTRWNKMVFLGFASFLFVFIYEAIPLQEFQPLLFGLSEGGLLLYLTFKG